MTKFEHIFRQNFLLTQFDLFLSFRFSLLKKRKDKVRNSSALLMQTYVLLKNECIYAKDRLHVSESSKRISKRRVLLDMTPCLFHMPETRTHTRGHTYTHTNAYRDTQIHRPKHQHHCSPDAISSPEAAVRCPSTPNITRAKNRLHKRAVLTGKLTICSWP